MPIAISLNPLTGKPYCDCCRLNLHHCKKCWGKHHNSHKGEDFIPPEFFGQIGFISEEIGRKVAKDLKIEYKVEVKADKNRKYVEGDYTH